MQSSPSPIGTFAIRGVITLRAPAFQTSPDGSGNRARTFETLVRTPDGTMVRLPYISPPSVRGQLRRVSAEHIWSHFRDRFAATQEHRFQVSRETFLSVNRGSPGRKDMKPGAASLQEIVAGGRNVFSGLFGGGYHMHRSRLHMESPLMPLVLEAIDTIHPRYQSYCSGSAFHPNDPDAPAGTPRSQRLAIVETYHLMPRDDFQDGGGVGVVFDHEAQLAEYQQEMVDTKEAKREQKAAQQAAKAAGQRLDIKPEDRVSVSTTKNMLELRAITPGTQLYLGIVLKAVTLGQLGLALISIRDWANQNTLGGGSARGFGSFSISLSLEDTSGVLVDASVLQGAAPFYRLCDHPLVSSAVAQAQAEIAVLDRAALEQIFPLAPSSAASTDAPRAGAKRATSTAEAGS